MRTICYLEFGSIFLLWYISTISLLCLIDLPLTRALLSHDNYLLLPSSHALLSTPSPPQRKYYWSCIRERRFTVSERLSFSFLFFLLLVRLTFLLFRFVPFSPSLARLDGMSRRGQSLLYGCGLLQLWRQFIATRAAAVARPRLLTDATPCQTWGCRQYTRVPAGCWKFKWPLFYRCFLPRE